MVVGLARLGREVLGPAHGPWDGVALRGPGGGVAAARRGGGERALAVRCRRGGADSGPAAPEGAAVDGAPVLLRFFWNKLNKE